MRKSLFIKSTAIVLTAFVFFFNTQYISADIGPRIKFPLFTPIVPDQISLTVDSSDYRKYQVNLIKAIKGKEILGKFRKKVSASIENVGVTLVAPMKKNTSPWR